jgi:hypothetical protein
MIHQIVLRAGRCSEPDGGDDVFVDGKPWRVSVWALLALSAPFQTHDLDQSRRPTAAKSCAWHLTENTMQLPWPSLRNLAEMP